LMSALGKTGGDAFANSLDELDRGGEFQHVSMLPTSNHT